MSDHVSGHREGQRGCDQLCESLKLAELTKGVARTRRPQLEKALQGFVTDHHRALLRQHLALVDALESSIKEIELRIGEALRPFAKEQVELLQTIPGISSTSASIVIAEIGVDMRRFPDAGQVVSWAGLRPRSDESAGKLRSRKLRRGNPWLKTALVQCAWAAVRTPGYLKSQFHRIRARAGKMRAVVAVAHTILVAIYHMLADSQSYRDLGEVFFDRRDADRLKRTLTRRLENLGYRVELRAVGATEPVAVQ